MKNTLLVFLALSVLAGCNSVRNKNLFPEKMISEKNLKADVDFTYKKLRKLHPKLYWYISKESLDYKFDSLKSTITKPMTSVEFYTKISPVIAAIKQGHTSIYPLPRHLSKKERDTYAKKGVGPLSQFEFDIHDNKLYIIKNNSQDKSIKPGTEVVAINNKNTPDLLQTYTTRFTSDGFNKTFKRNELSRSFSIYYTLENGIQDSIKYAFKHNDTLKTSVIKRSEIDSLKTADNKRKKKEKTRNKTEKKNTRGYDPITGTYNRNLRFMEKDSSIAILKINEFSLGDYYGFYNDSFTKMYRYGTKTLILDLRDNPGGRLDEIAHLYTYLADGTFIFMDDSQVVSKTSMLSGEYFRDSSFGVKIIRALIIPVYYPYMFFKTHKKSDGNYYFSVETKPESISPIAFGGKIYVLINGGSISASSLISSNLKGSGRAFFVGEETGGAFNGTVAGKMYVSKLPHSKLNIRFGLMVNSSNYETVVDGRGIFPDKVIIPTLKDRIEDRDPEMEWILQDIKANQ
ncbi:MULTISPECIES: S41 family peptidase [Flavobacterium]|uniref:S41 family peptidase n=1 Tax=Flavobacterium TaxID=237 RepID=UPI001FCBA03D|nr:MULTISPECIES: S41 family peptidase [Flavobacterium]UOK41582.1 S41 family peptidase [Flavobacterium enshiense]